MCAGEHPDSLSAEIEGVSGTVVAHLELTVGQDRDAQRDAVAVAKFAPQAAGYDAPCCLAES